MNDLIQIGWSLYGACVRYAVNIPDNPNLRGAAVKTQTHNHHHRPPPRFLTLLFGETKKKETKTLENTFYSSFYSAVRRQRHRDQSGCRLLIPTTQPLINCAVL